MKFPMYEKETKDKKYRDDPYRAVNFRVNEAGRLVCPNGKEFLFLRTEPVKGNQYGRTVELHQQKGHKQGNFRDCPDKLWF